MNSHQRKVARKKREKWAREVEAVYLVHLSMTGHTGWVNYWKQNSLSNRFNRRQVLITYYNDAVAMSLAGATPPDDLKLAYQGLITRWYANPHYTYSSYPKAAPLPQSLKGATP